jgi:hypothetical protein
MNGALVLAVFEIVLANLYPRHSLDSLAHWIMAAIFTAAFLICAQIDKMKG